MRCGGGYSEILASRADLFGATSVVHWSFFSAVLRIFPLDLDLDDTEIFEALLIATVPTSGKNANNLLYSTHNTRIPTKFSDFVQVQRSKQNILFLFANGPA